MIVQRPLRTILHFFTLRKISNLYLHGSQINYYLCPVHLDDLNFAYAPYYSLLCLLQEGFGLSSSPGLRGRRAGRDVILPGV